MKQSSVTEEEEDEGSDPSLWAESKMHQCTEADVEGKVAER